MSYELTTPPAEEPLSLIEAKRHVRVDHADEDDGITALVRLARRKVEHDSRRTLITSTWAKYLDEFPRAKAACGRPGLTGRMIRLTIPPVQSVTQVTYYDVDGNLQTLDSDTYWTDLKSTPAAIVLKNGQFWPATETGRPNAVIIALDAGYGDAADVPEEAKHAMRLLIGHWYQNREASLIGTISKEIEFAYTSLIDQLSWTKHFSDAA